MFITARSNISGARQRLATTVVLCAFVATTLSCRRDPPQAPKSDDGVTPSQRDASDTEIVRAGNVVGSSTVLAYRDFFMQHAQEINRDFPLHVGMSTMDLDAFISRIESQSGGDDGWSGCVLRSDIHDGDGFVSFLFDTKLPVWCDASIEGGHVANIWLMWGGPEIYSGLYFRVAGRGPRRGVLPQILAKDQKRN